MWYFRIECVWLINLVKFLIDGLWDFDEVVDNEDVFIRYKFKDKMLLGIIMIEDDLDLDLDLDELIIDDFDENEKEGDFV